MCTYPLSAETLEPLARFVRKITKDSNLAEDGFPGLINQEFLGSFSTDKSICSPKFINLVQGNLLHRTIVIGNINVNVL